MTTRRGSAALVTPAAAPAGRPERALFAVTDPGEPSGEPALRVLSTAVAGLARSHGRRPSAANSWRIDERCVVTALFDFLTPAENALVKAGDAALVRQLRCAFAAATAHEYLQVADAALGEEVIAHSSELVCESRTCLEFFLLT